MLDQDGAELVHGLEELVPGAVLVVHHLLDVVVPLPVIIYILLAGGPSQGIIIIIVPGAVLVVHHLLDVVVPLPVLAEPHELAQVTQVTGSGHGQYHRLLRG